jgi:hypothetical protein
MSESKEQWFDILTGKKKITIRTWYRDYVPGLVMIVSPKTNRCVEATLTDVKYYLAKNVPEADCIADGFSGLEDMILGMKNYYPDFNSESEVTVVKWKDVRGLLAEKLIKGKYEL